MPDELPPSQGSITWLPDGRTTITFEDGSPTLTLSRPTYGQLKRFRLRLSEVQTSYREAIEKAVEIEDADEKAAEFERISESVDHGLIEWWRDVTAGLARGDAKLPEDPDDWPSDLILGERLGIRMLDHWMHVPLDRGSGDRQLPKIRP